VRGGPCSVGASVTQLIRIVTHPNTHLIYVRGRAGELVAQKLGFGAAWGPNAEIGVTRNALRALIEMEAEIDADLAKRIGGNASECWLSSDAEVITRGLGALRIQHNELYLETFRARMRS
jgi:hypothetical protein